MQTYYIYSLQKSIEYRQVSDLCLNNVTAFEDWMPQVIHAQYYFWIDFSSSSNTCGHDCNDFIDVEESEWEGKLIQSESIDLISFNTESDWEFTGGYNSRTSHWRKEWIRVECSGLFLHLRVLSVNEWVVEGMPALKNKLKLIIVDEKLRK